jgi:hypothetical protein
MTVGNGCPRVQTNATLGTQSRWNRVPPSLKAFKRPSSGSSVAVWAGVVLAAGACADDSTGPKPGPVLASIESSSGAEGAAVVELVGKIDEVAAVAGHVFTTVRGDTTRVIVVRPDSGAIEFRFVLRDLSVALSGRVLEVAAPDNSVRPDASAYTVKFSNAAPSP